MMKADISERPAALADVARRLQALPDAGKKFASVPPAGRPSFAPYRVRLFKTAHKPTATPDALNCKPDLLMHVRS
jgi:hypothetical protein